MKIDREELLDALAKIKPGLANKEIIEFTTHFVFDRTKIWTYNDQISVSHKIKTGLEGAIRGDEFYALINKMADKTIDINLAENKFVIEGRRTKAEINIVKDHGLPGPVNEKIKWLGLPDDFSEAVKFCLFSVGKDMTRPDLTNLNVYKNKIVSSDRFRITKFELEKEIPVPFLLPGEPASFLVNYSPIEYAVQKEWIRFRNDAGTIFSARIMPLEYPDVERFFNVQGQKMKFPAGLKESIDRAEILAKTEFENDVFVSLKLLPQGQLICRGEGKLGFIEEKYRIKYNGPETGFQIHPLFLKEILSRLKNVVIGEKALLFQGEKFQHVIAIISQGID